MLYNKHPVHLMLNACVIPWERAQKEEQIDQRLHKSPMIYIQVLYMCGSVFELTVLSVFICWY